jgi:hypothetical protein
LSKPIPNMDQAVIPMAKITDYLLSDTHPIGRSKAAFFRGCGFSVDQPDVVIGALKKHAKTHGAYSKPTSFGLKYIVDGEMDTPARGAVCICAIWFIEIGASHPVFVTAYPFKKVKP